MMKRSSSNVRPSVEPAPAVFSSRIRGKVPPGASHRVIQAAGDGLEAALGSRPHVGAGMEDQGPDCERVTATQLLNERASALVPEVAIGAREVDEIRAVRDDGTDTARLHRVSKASGLLRRQSARAPLDLISGEDLNRLGVDAPTALWSLVQPSGRRHVRSEEHQWPVTGRSMPARPPRHPDGKEPRRENTGSI